MKKIIRAVAVAGLYTQFIGLVPGLATAAVNYNGGWEFSSAHLSGNGVTNFSGASAYFVVGNNTVTKNGQTFIVPIAKASDGVSPKTYGVTTWNNSPIGKINCIGGASGSGRWRFSYKTTTPYQCEISQ